MDGTLTRAVHDFDMIREQLGLEPGVPILEAIDAMASQKAMETHARLNEIEMELAFDAMIQPGARELLECLEDSGRQTGILTRNGEAIAIQTLKSCGLDRFFPKEVVIGRETCAPKPKPDGVNYLLQLWNAEPTKTVIVGDYRYDIEAGHIAGIKTVHFDETGTFPWPQFMDHGVSELRELTAMIKS